MTSFKMKGLPLIKAHPRGYVLSLDHEVRSTALPRSTIAAVIWPVTSLHVGLAYLYKAILRHERVRGRG